MSHLLNIIARHSYAIGCKLNRNIEVENIEHLFLVKRKGSSNNTSKILDL